MFWNKKKDSSRVVWRNKNNSIYCPGDLCTSECDAKCPIWLNTKGLQLIGVGQLDEAIKMFNDALVLAPDFVDAYNNIGSAYGMKGCHKEAYRAFEKALVINPKYLKAFSGLIVSEKNLGMYEEALQHCDDFERLGGDAENLRLNIYEAISVDHKDTVINYLDLVSMLLKNGREAGYIVSKDFAHIPEIMVSAEDVCKKICVAIGDHYKESNSELLNVSSVIFAWAAYAGIGAVYHWHNDWNELSSSGVYETLIRERGIFAMDEYVMDTVGIKFGSDEERALTGFIRIQADYCITTMIKDNVSANSLIACAKAMYLFGMVFEMNRLGMF